MKKLLLLLTFTSSIFLVGCHQKDLTNAGLFLELVERYGNEEIGCVVVPGISCHSFSNINSNINKLKLNSLLPNFYTFFYN